MEEEPKLFPIFVFLYLGIYSGHGRGARNPNILFLYLRTYSGHGRGARNIPNNCISVLIQDMEEEPGDWVAHQAEVDTLINKIQVVGTTFVLCLLLLIKMYSLV